MRHLKFSRLFIAVATTTAFSCVALIGCQAAGSTAADMVMRNGYVYTVDGKNSVQQAIAVSGGKIVKETMTPDNRLQWTALNRNVER
jgi:prophage DNA circulation protein